MADDLKNIIEKAEELSALIKDHAYAIEYQQSLNLMQHDPASQELLKRIVLFGKELNEKISMEENDFQNSAENKLLMQQLEKNDLVKQYIQNQKAYITMMQLVLERIRNPKPE